MNQFLYWTTLAIVIQLCMGIFAPHVMFLNRTRSILGNVAVLLKGVSFAVIIGYIFGWCAMASLYFSVNFLIVLLAIFALAVIHRTAFTGGLGEYIEYRQEIIRLRWVLGVCVVMVAAFWAVTSSSITRHKEIAELLDISEVEQSLFASVEEPEMRVMPKDAAYEVAKKALGKRTDDGLQLGAMYGINKETMTLQYFDSRQYWIAPLEHKSILKEMRADGIYGYVKVKADTADYEPELVKSHMRFSPSASFGDNLKRLIVTNYPARNKQERKFMIDDKGRPVFVQFFSKNGVGYSNDIFDGGVIVDAVTGDMTEFEHGNPPSWMNYSISEKVLLSRLNSWGRFRNGFIKGLFGNQSLMVPTSLNETQTLYFVDVVGTSNGKAFYTGLTNKSGNNASAGMVYADPITGNISLYYPDSTASPDEEAIIKQVEAALGINADRWTPTEPIPYRVYDTIDVWLTPIVSKTNIVVGYAFSDVNTPNRTVWDKDLAVALNKMMSLGVNSGAVPNLSLASTYFGVVRTYVVDNEKAYITIRSSDGVVPKLFECDGSLISGMPECLALYTGMEIAVDAHSRGRKRASIAHIHDSVLESDELH
ncbi:hypothetical protein [Vibrio sp. D431a]|uniref:hypothetical protein n=1 Tax=Vibrio sp. D431a TaxID=2837388 RepID=UPI002553C2BD|nr:hypothetical protein [Vibrio sp. D431a]MDK9790037.1 hypothetical protein [Vibrio sp. D431a]